MKPKYLYSGQTKMAEFLGNPYDPGRKIKIKHMDVVISTQWFVQAKKMF